MPPKVYLLAQTHIDPVWLWDWTEGVAVTLATFRSVAALCERYPELRFNQNEALLYEWTEEYAPELFERIRQLVERGQWHVAGGWYLQPDCNLPCGEAMVRQILVGRRYFRERFGVEPVVALNVDSFGHSRGLVQILARSGYRGYIFCRPPQQWLPLPSSVFVWQGVDGSRVLAIRADSHYNTPAGKAAQKLQQWLASAPAELPVLFPWGVGNHGGGPSAQDMEEFRRLEREGLQLQHATPEMYLQALQGRELPVVECSLRPWAVGAYTSQIRLKRLYRRLEDEYLLTEKLCTCAAANGVLPYPKQELDAALRDLLFCQFHDILGGTTTEQAYESALRRLQHGLESLARLKFRAFLALSAGQQPAEPGVIPVLVYNPHPYPVRTLLECELHAEEPEPAAGQWRVQVFAQGEPIPCQELTPEGAWALGIRKRILFPALLQPQRMHRFECRLEPVATAPAVRTQPAGAIRIRTPWLEVEISRTTGLLERYVVGGRNYARAGMGLLRLLADDADAWGMQRRRFDRTIGRFRPLPKARAAEFAGVVEPLHPVRIIEEGQLCTIVEVLLHYRYRSFACLHYVIPHEGTELELRLRLFWNERNALLKLCFPTTLLHAKMLGQSMFAVEELPANGSEQVAQRWVCLREGEYAVSCITDSTYGVDCRSGELRLSLVRSPAYAGHPSGEGSRIVPPDRFTARLDQGEHLFRFWLNAGPAQQRLERLEREAQQHLQPPVVFPLAPSGEGAPPQPLLSVSDPVVVCTALKHAEHGDAVIVRLWNPTGDARRCRVELPVWGIAADVHLQPFALSTLRVDPQRRRIGEVDLLERG